MTNSGRVAVFLAASTALLLLASARRPVIHEEPVSARQLLQDFGSNTPAGFRPGTLAGTPCPAGQQHCNEKNACVNLQTDKLNCGRCANACDFNTEVCAGGRCACMPGTTFCTNVGKCFSNCNGFEPEANNAQGMPQQLNSALGGSSSTGSTYGQVLGG